ncbi:MAG TPA: hypothetical protein VEY33_10250 [Gemmatimonadota bacterium]|nr:hypothetical protein [Gemmatimonadota bacterium]
MSWTQGLGLLLWMGTAALVVAAAVAAGVAWRRGSHRAAGRIALGMGAWLLAYGTVLAAVSLASDERVLARGETKWFCGVYLDCHVGVAVPSVRNADVLGEGEATLRANGRFWIVSLTIENSAIRVPLGLYDPEARVADAAGRSWDRVIEAERALAGEPADLTREVPPGGSYTVELVYDLPEDVADPRLLVTEKGLPERLAERVLIGDDDSLLHAPTTLRIS